MLVKKRRCSSLIVSGALFVLLPAVMALGIVSCAGTPGKQDGMNDVSVNTDRSDNGSVYTTVVYRTIRSVVLTDSCDGSKKIRLTASQWNYDPETTELTVRTDVPFSDYRTGVQGDPAVPYTFVLNGLTDPDDLMVAVDGRPAIAGYDYFPDFAAKKLVFRKDIDLKKMDWHIAYQTAEGNTALGEWKSEDRDRLSYLEAVHQQQYLDSWYDSQTSWWFLQVPVKRGEKPGLIRQPPSPEQIAAVKAAPSSVWKSRPDATEQKLASELGFPVFFPGTISVPGVQGAYRIGSKGITEYAEAGKGLIKELDVEYRFLPADSGEKVPLQFTLAVRKKPADAPQLQAEEDLSPDTGNGLIVSRDTVNAGRPVRRVRQWVMMTRNLNEKPSVVCMSFWSWQTDSASYTVSAESRYDTVFASCIKQIIGKNES